MPMVECIAQRANTVRMPIGKVRPAFSNVCEVETPYFAYVSYWDIVEHGALLAQYAVAHDTPYKLWSFSTGSSWIGERFWSLVRDVDDWAFASEVCRYADGIILSEYHNYPLNWEKIMPKRIAVLHHGMFLRENYKRLNKLEQDYGYLRFVSTPDLLLYGDAIWLPICVPVREIQTLYPRQRHMKRKLIVGHGYTIAANKQTDTINSVLKDLERRGYIEARLWTGLTRRESLWHLRGCDIYVATLLYGPGVATVEAWAMGIPTICGCSQDELEMQERCYGRELPFVYANNQNRLRSAILKLLADEEMREEYRQRGYKAAQLHEAANVWDIMIRHLKRHNPSQKALKWDGNSLSR